MKKNITILLLLTSGLLSLKARSQLTSSRYYSFKSSLSYEVGAGIGIMNCITDIGGANGDKSFYINEVRSKNFRPTGSIYGLVMYQDYLGARLEATIGQVQSADTDIKGTTLNAESRRIRNLSFRNNIYELLLTFEFHPLLLLTADEKEWIIDPYISAGIGLFSFNPKTEYQGKWIDLQPLHTEGQGFPEYPAVSNYKLTQANIPLGIGVLYKLSNKYNLRLEYVHRILFTDYLDDASSRKFINPSAFDKNLSPALAADAKALYNRSSNVRVSVRRGNPDNNDTYMSLSIKLGMVLGR